MTRDRLPALTAAQSEDSDGWPEDTELNLEKNEHLERFLRQAEEVKEKIDKIESYVQEIKKVHSAILSAPQSDNKTKQQLEDLMADVQKISREVRNDLKAIEPSNELEEEFNMSELHLLKTQISVLSSRFVEVMALYNRTQTDYKEACVARIKRHFEIIGQSTTDEEIYDMLDHGDPVTAIKESMSVETQEARQTLADIEARHADIIKLENSIRELHDMFVDMTMLVESQGKMIDRIECYVNDAADNVKEATYETRKARNMQSKVRRKKIMILICLAILIVLVGGGVLMKFI